MSRTRRRNRTLLPRQQQILELITERGPMTVSEIAIAIGIGNSLTYRYLRDMLGMQYLSKTHFRPAKYYPHGKDLQPEPDSPLQG